MSNPNRLPEAKNLLTQEYQAIAQRIKDEGITMAEFRRLTENRPISYFDDVIIVTRTRDFAAPSLSPAQKKKLISWCEKTRKELLNQIKLSGLNDRGTALEKRVTAFEKSNRRTNG
ncbi:hypothetical protein [Geminisphaera colitermitum]|uniref:hypothetical protein n=1 Tax=Geminisphaera colitermitum TaxID=1148786 RepID=UPI0001964FED|nr:hypothetical protein [Geminisphaera colitermitum]